MERRRLWLAAAVAAAAIIAAAAAACGGTSGGTPTPTPTPSVSGVSPVAGTPTPTPLPSIEPTAYRFLYSEFGAEEDIIWSIDPAGPSNRDRVASVPHKAGFAIKPAVSPDGKKIAYNVMPEAGVRPRTDAETRILELETGKTRLVAERVDLQVPPLWSPDGGLLFLRRKELEEVTVILIDLIEREEDDGQPPDEDAPPPVRTVLRQHVSDVRLYLPLGFDADEATLYFAQVQGGTESGSYLGRYAPATGEVVATATAIVEATATARAGTPIPTPTPPPTPPPLPGDVFLVLSDQTARDYALSPDASRLAFLVPGLVNGQFVLRTHVADIERQRVSPLNGGVLAAGEHLSPVWYPTGDRVSVGLLSSGGEPGRVALVPIGGGDVTFLPNPEQGFDQPLGWSPDGKFLAVRHFSGDSLANPGGAGLVFVSPQGQRPAAPEGPDFEPVGWKKGS